MKSQIIIAAIAIIITVHETNAALDTSKLRVNLENNRPAYEPTKIKPEDRRKLLSLFPKHTAKFIITTEQPIRTTNKGHSQTFIKKPSLRKNDFKTTTESNQYNQKVTSMKAKKFSIQEDQKIKRVPTLNNNLNPMWPKTQIIKNEQNYAKRQEPNLRNGEVFSESLEEDTTGETIIEDVEIEMTSKGLPPTSTKKIARKYPGFKRPKRDSFLIGNEIFISNENQLDENFVEDLDQIEFIFIDNAEQNELNKGNLSSGEESTDAPIYFQGKPKRSIIEEENLASTIPSFTYTGRDVVLRDELSYRNINE